MKSNMSCHSCLGWLHHPMCSVLREERAKLAAKNPTKTLVELMGEDAPELKLSPRPKVKKR